MKDSMQGNGARFLAAFNDMEDHFRRILHADDHVDFGELARRYSDRAHLLPEQRQALSAFAGLRNAISHGRYHSGKPIAEPVPDVVEDIERLRDLIKSPPSAVGVMGSMKVASLSPSDPITVALEFVRDFDFSQFPVYDGDRFVGLLTTNAIARWLAHQMATTGGLAETEMVSEVLRFAEPHEKAKLVSRKTTVTSAVYELSGEGTAVPVAALIVTTNGKASERPLAVVVADDLPKLYRALR